MDARPLAARLRTPTGFDCLLAGALAVASLLEVWLAGSWGGPRGLGTANALLITLSLVARRARPWRCSPWWWRARLCYLEPLGARR